MVPLSILDLAPIPEGSNASASFRDSLDLAQHAERWGYRRVWLAEHHGMPGIASAATAVLLANIAAGTRTIRVGAGGIMLPNHAPLIIAEQFGTLEALYPGRIDLGLGRAPGTDQRTSRALRRNLAVTSDEFPDDVIELMDYFSKSPQGVIRAIPGEGLEVPIWILGSSLFGAQLAAALGLPYAFASHFAPAQLDDAVKVYRARFRPSARLAAPYVMVAFNVFAADRARDAELMASSVQQAFLNLRSGRPTKLPPPVEGLLKRLGEAERAMLASVLTCTAIGTGEDARAGLDAFAARTSADEIIVTCMAYDHAARLRSYEIVADVMGLAKSA